MKQNIINKKESTGLKYLNDSKAFIEYSHDMDDIYRTIEEYNPNKSQITFVVFDGIIADMLSNKKLNLIVTELFIGRRKLKIYLVFMTQSYFSVANNVTLNLTHHLVMKIPQKREIQQITFNHTSDIDFQDFTNIFKNVEQNYIFF